MQIFVTGSSSFIGRELISQCIKSGIRYSGVDLAESNQENCVVGDIRAAEIIDAIPWGCDTVVHLAALSREADCAGRTAEWMKTNVLATQNVVRAAKSKGIKSFVFASSEWVYDGFGDVERREDDNINLDLVNSQYGKSKLMAEDVLRKYSDEIGVAILRFGIVYGPRKNNWSAVETLFDKVAHSNLVEVGSLYSARHFIHVSDIAAAVFASLGRRGFEIFNIQGGKLITLGEIIDTSCCLLNKSVDIIESDAPNPSIRRISVRKAKDMLSWKPKVSLVEGLESLRSIMYC